MLELLCSFESLNGSLHRRAFLRCAAMEKYLHLCNQQNQASNKEAASGEGMPQSADSLGLHGASGRIRWRES